MKYKYELIINSEHKITVDELLEIANNINCNNDFLEVEINKIEEDIK